MTIPRFDPLALRPKAGTHGPAPMMSLLGLAPRLIDRMPEAVAPAAPQRTRMWEMSRHLHCSIIGTCLSTAELRQVLGKLKLVVDGASDHDLHKQGVTLAGQQGGAAKLLHKALDKRHRLSIAQFDKAHATEDVRQLWRDAVKRGDIPGAYWAALTHPRTTDALVRDIFGEVHMLSHLVGAANRADIRRLSALEAENAALQEKLRRQQDQLRDGITARDVRIRDLNALLARRIAESASADDVADAAAGQAQMTRLVRDLERRLGTEAARRAAAEKRVERLADTLRQEGERRAAAERSESAIRAELEAVEASLAPAAASSDDGTLQSAGMDGLSLLYVGGRPSQVSHLRALGEQLGVMFLHHDGGVEDRSGLLSGLVSRADVVMFPVDCVSHEAVVSVKRLCRQTATPYVPLRSAGLSSFVAALARANAVARQGHDGEASVKQVPAAPVPAF